MSTMNESYESLSLLIELNQDRLLYLAVLGVALTFGAFLGAPP
ncbi:hypothetical protein OG2516_01989 [Oceanicola granulosus HTCC2516]|uniref:Uncharacterized protein n=1 Tax=Oceanicola granulosus (strain ATCC BAA-861 / DSM 15982 / KCTC 12143 / HTCC2516) TaxID=314256 RepID=Q2CHX6_OCEGH|nr:hypothetical protein [Oceanicola granulosus]EAR52168.1 hypothetical protein OG2516_01989 [Oceanicola granulosus HTCC2516]